MATVTGYSTARAGNSSGTLSVPQSVHNLSAPLVPSAAYSPEETALSEPSLEPEGECRRQLLQSFIFSEERHSYCSAWAGAEVGD